MREGRGIELLKRIAIAAGILAGGMAAGFLLLCLVFLLPTDRMLGRQSLSADIMYQEGTHYQVVHGVVATTTDNYTDGQMLNMAVVDSDTSLTDRVINAYRAEYMLGDRPDLSFANLVRGEEGYVLIEYPRYWHGYLVFLKPLLLFFNYAEIRLIYVFLQTGLFLWVVALLLKRNKSSYVIPFLTAVFCLMPIATTLSLQYSSILYITMAAVILILYQHEKIWEHKWYYILFLAVGMLTSYLDFLTYPMITLGVPLTVFYCVLDKQEHIGREICRIIGYSISWAAGYFGMWMGKWILADVFLKQDIIAGSLDTIAYRASRSAYIRGSESISYFSVLWKNIRVITEKPFLLCMGLAFIYMLLRIIKNKCFRLHRLGSAVPFAVICFMPLVWYLVSCNHSYIHSYMTYRELVIAVFAGLCMLAKLGEGEVKNAGINN